MDARLLVIKIGETLRDEGVKGTLERVFRLLHNEKPADAFDVKYGTNTAGTIPLWRLDVKSKNARFGRSYQPITAELFRSCICRIEVDPSSCAFVDLGCGKGRTLIIAAELGFAQVIGVEFARELADVAKRNLQKLNIGNATIIHGDAAEYQFPDSNLVLYMYNPFAADVMSKLIDRLGEFSAKHPHRQVFVIYHRPLCANIIDRAPFLQRFDVVQGEPQALIWRRRGIGVGGR
ncbi:MAG: class I SAM-dependent methyltransferase [Candidatus Binataceae bacterium]